MSLGFSGACFKTELDTLPKFISRKKTAREGLTVRFPAAAQAWLRQTTTKVRHVDSVSKRHSVEHAPTWTWNNCLHLRNFLNLVFQQTRTRQTEGCLGSASFLDWQENWVAFNRVGRNCPNWPKLSKFIEPHSVEVREHLADAKKSAEFGQKNPPNLGPISTGLDKVSARSTHFRPKMSEIRLRHGLVLPWPRIGWISRLRAPLFCAVAAARPPYCFCGFPKPQDLQPGPLRGEAARTCAPCCARRRLLAPR